MNLTHQRGVDVGQHRFDCHAVVDAVDVEIVEVQQDAAAGAARECSQEGAFGDGLLGIDQRAAIDIRGDVFNQQRPLESVLRAHDVGAHEFERLAGIGQGQQVVDDLGTAAVKAQVLGNGGGRHGIGQRGNGTHVVNVQPVGIAEPHAHAVQAHGLVRPCGQQRGAGRAAIQVVLAVHFHPGEAGFLVQQSGKVRGAQACTGARG